MQIQHAIGAAAVAALLYSPVVYASEGEQSAANRTQIMFLGTSSGPPLHLDRSEPATLLTVDGRQYLIDCGIGTVGRMIEAGIDSKQIKTIFFTHLHADHDLGIADLMANDFFQRGAVGAADPISIYGPPQTKELVDAAFRFISVGFRPFAAHHSGAYQMRGNQLVSPFVSHEIRGDGVVFQDDKIRVTAAENSHYALMTAVERRRFKSYSFRIETPHGVVVFTGDTGPTGDIAMFAKDADVLIAEASYRDAAALDGTTAARAARNNLTPARAKVFKDHFIFEHLDASAVGQLASKASVKSVILHHYNPSTKADQAAYVKLASAYFAGPVFASDDLKSFCITGSGSQNSLTVQAC